jgi:ubiquinone/menaquinone biosynthesis C-methylase UbiE
MLPYDTAAPTFECDRALPNAVAESIRVTVLNSIYASSPRFLDIGAGTGRIGRSFVRAGDDYVGVDLSFGMLRMFMQQTDDLKDRPRLIRADGERLPFRDNSFDAVMLIQVFGGVVRWRALLDEARRVLRTFGVLILGHTIAPNDGVDERMKRRLAALLAELGVKPAQLNARKDVQNWLKANARGKRMIAARWTAVRTPRGFLKRHRTGARFAALPDAVKENAMSALSTWAKAAFGSVDMEFREPYAFELEAFTFLRETDR